MEIKILGTGCPRCKGLYETTERAIAELGLDATLAKEQDILKIIEYKVLGLPRWWSMKRSCRRVRACRSER